MSTCKVSFVGALMLVLTGTTAGAADLDGDYRLSMKDGSYEKISEYQRGWYLRGDIGYGYNSDPDLSDSNKAKFVGDSLDDTFIVGGGVGYNLMRGFRVDLTLDYRTEAEVFGYFPANPPNFSPLTGELSSWVGLANFYYDLDMGHRFTPYVGVGLGFAAHTVDAGKQTNSGFDDVDFDGDTDTSFAWALMAGVDVDLRSNWKLDIGYRYMDLGDYSAKDAKTGTKEFNIDDLQSHEIRVGLRYQLGCLMDCGVTHSYDPYK